MESILVNGKEAARMLAISERTLWGLKTQGVIPSVKTGKSVRYRVEALRQWAQVMERSGIGTNGPTMMGMNYGKH